MWTRSFILISPEPDMRSKLFLSDLSGLSKTLLSPKMCEISF